MEVTVKFEGKGIADLFNLRCVRSIEKLRDGSLMATVQGANKNRRSVAFVGDKITYDSEKPETGKVWRNDKNKNKSL